MTVKNSWKLRLNKPLFCVFVIKGRILTYLRYLNAMNKELLRTLGLYGMIITLKVTTQVSIAYTDPETAIKECLYERPPPRRQ